MNRIVRLMRCSGWLGALLLAGGCYFSTGPAVTLGEEIGVEPGEYLCQGESMETLQLRRRVEANAGGPDVIYSLDRTDYRLARVDTGFYLAQGNEASAFSYAFIDVSDVTRIRVLGPDPQAAVRMRDLAARHRLRTAAYLASGDRDAMLTGAAADVRSFLLAHDRSLLSERANCTRKPLQR